MAKRIIRKAGETDSRLSFQELLLKITAQSQAAKKLPAPELCCPCHDPHQENGHLAAHPEEGDGHIVKTGSRAANW